MRGLLEKKERQLGEKLFLKQERCIGQKCVTVRRAYPPGAHGKKRARTRQTSEFNALLREKQKVRYIYGLDDRELGRYSEKAALARSEFALCFLQLLERRLDNVIFRLGLAPSRRTARQLIGHGHVTVNGRMLNIPSYQVRIGDVLGVKERAKNISWHSAPPPFLKDQKIASWLQPGERSGTVIGLPGAENADIQVDFTKIRQFYAR